MQKIHISQFPLKSYKEHQWTMAKYNYLKKIQPYHKSMNAEVDRSHKTTTSGFNFFLTKCFERLIRKPITEHLKVNNRYKTNQHCFWKGRQIFLFTIT